MPAGRKVSFGVTSSGRNCYTASTRSLHVADTRLLRMFLYVDKVPAPLNRQLMFDLFQSALTIHVDVAVAQGRHGKCSIGSQVEIWCVQTCFAQSGTRSCVISVCNSSKASHDMRMCTMCVACRSLLQQTHMCRWKHRKSDEFQS